MVDPAQRSQLIQQAATSKSRDRAAMRARAVESIQIRTQSTPGQLRLARTLLILVVFVIVTTAMSSARKQTKFAKSYATQSSEAVLNSYRLYDAAAGMDAFAAKGIASSSVVFAVDGTTKKQRDDAVAALLEKRVGTNTGFEERREKLAQRILNAAAGAGDPDADTYQAKPLLRLQLGTTDYLLGLKRAEDELTINPSTNSERQAAADYLAAAETMDQTILPSVKEIIEVTSRSQENTVNNFTTAGNNTKSRTLLGGFGFILLVLLLKFVLFRRTNRILNPALVMVCVLTMMYIIFSGIVVGNGKGYANSAASDFSGLVNQRLARASGYNASSIQSRQLLPGADVATLEKSFQESVDGVLQEDSLASDLVEVHRQIRERDAVDHAGAVLLAQTDKKFDGFLERNQRLIDSSKPQFEREARSMTTNNSSFAKVSWLYFLITSALIIVGLRPRIREFF
jgi:hypothetical protein